MTKEQVLESIALKKRFCKDCDIPITVFDNPYFMQRLEVLDPLFNGLEQFECFCKTMEGYNSESEYLDASTKLTDAIIQFIKLSLDITGFNEEPCNIGAAYPKKNLYIAENDKRVFISIDMKKANFSALYYYSPEIFNNKSTWEEYMSQFTSDPYFKNSKYIRQVIMGNCNPKRQILYEKKLMSALANYILANSDFELYSLTNDELIFDVTDYEKDCYAEITHLVNTCPDKLNKLVRIDIFELQKIPTLNSYIKVFKNKTDHVYEFKCVEAEIYHQIVKYYLSQDISEDDLVIFHNGRLAKFLEPIKNPWQASS